MTFKDLFIDSNGNLIDGSGVSIVILDTGVDSDHPFFGPDEDNNGIADKIAHQYDFGGDVLGGNNDSQAIDTDGHGTHVASIATSSDPNYPGVAPGATLIPLKVFPDGKKQSGSMRDIEEALQWVLANKDRYNIVAVNLSLGDEKKYTSALNNYSLISNELYKLAKDDIAVVSAAGNSKGLGVSYPAADAYSLAVSAVDNQGRIAGFSQHHPQLTDVFARGVNITAARNNGGTVSLSGTSMATPHVSGAIAIAQQLALQELGRRLTFDEIKTLLKQGDPVTNKPEYGKKLLNITKLGDAILQMSSYDPTTHLTLRLDGSSESQRVLSYGGNKEDVVSKMRINDREKKLTLRGNTWKKIEIGDYEITKDTVLKFEFESSKQGEIHTIGFDNNNRLDNSDKDRFFKVYGTESFGKKIGNYREGKVSYSINVGKFLSGNFDYLVIGNDDDKNANSESIFSNIQLYEQQQVINSQPQELLLTIGGNQTFYSIQSYAQGKQDIVSDITIDGTGTELTLEGNTWKKFEIDDYIITENTVLEFQFESGQEGEIHAIGFDNNDKLSSSDEPRFFKVYGTQAWGLENFDNYSPGRVQTYQINVGGFFTGSFNYLVLANDDDVTASAESVFSNIKLYEQPQIMNTQQQDFLLTIGGNQTFYSIQSYAQGKQDIVSDITIDGTGTELTLEGNTWKKFEIDDYIITENTVLEFQFESGKEGEIHAIGFEENDTLSSLDELNFFKVYGTQAWGLENFDNYSPGEIKTYQINVGEFFTGPFNYLVLANDDDVNASAKSVFSNIKLYETTDISPQNEVVDRLIGKQSLDVFTLENSAFGVSDRYKTKNEVLIPQSDINEAIMNLGQNIPDYSFSSGSENLPSKTTVFSELNPNNDLPSMIRDNSENNVDHSTLLS